MLVGGGIGYERSEVHAWLLQVRNASLRFDSAIIEN